MRRGSLAQEKGDDLSPGVLPWDKGKDPPPVKDPGNEERSEGSGGYLRLGAPRGPLSKLLGNHPHFRPEGALPTATTRGSPERGQPHSGAATRVTPG